MYNSASNYIARAATSSRDRISSNSTGMSITLTASGCVEDCYNPNSGRIKRERSIEHNTNLSGLGVIHPTHPILAQNYPPIPGFESF